MKKRKELNALIGLGGDSKRKKTKKGSGHRLLRTEPPDSDSESSSEDDDDEFSSLSGAAAFGKSYARCCNICYPLCTFIILVACVMACAGLIWMQVALKEDLDSLKEKFHTMESSQSVSLHEIPKLNEDLKGEQKRLELLENGDMGLKKLWSNITEINKKITLLDTAVSLLKANIKSASDIINLPTTIEALQKSVATIGSTLTSVQHDVNTLQTGVEDQMKAVNILKKEMVERQIKGDKNPKDKVECPAEKVDNCSSLLPLKQEVLSLQDALSKTNATQRQYQSEADETIHSLNSSITTLIHKVSFLESGFLLLNTTPSSHLTGSPQTNPGDKLVSGKGEAANRVRFTDPESSPEEDVKIPYPEPAVNSAGGFLPTKPLNPTRRPRFLSQSVSKKELGRENQIPISFPGISSLKDLENVFHNVEEGALSYDDLKKTFGLDIPEVQLLEQFDTDGDGKFSLLELRSATGL
ncbi:EF-hand calcium-binding domain-containing protein 14 isoform X2 [Scleropages formosus]|uniref:EF-hand calcium-binding domain-containing protein 14 isoform X2 n=1 Tax=Scleropages formosus TaxID=113540 RepID=UPI000878CC29|nr:EF-hand calcium-binding domain-containing protein 14 isoform X2 [Scleropages formosus]